MLQIPFVIIVQPHLLKEVSSVYLRSMGSDLTLKSNVSEGDELVHLSSLVSSIKTKLSSFQDQDYDSSETFVSTNKQLSRGLSQKEVGSIAKPHQSSPEVDVTYAKTVEKREKTTKIKRPKDIEKKASQSAKSYLKRICNLLETQSTSCVPVIAIDLPFSVLREFGTVVMSQNGRLHGAASQISGNYSKYKKNLRLLESELEKLLTRVNSPNTDGGKKKSFSQKEAESLILLLYSIPDDNTDLLEINGRNRA